MKQINFNKKKLDIFLIALLVISIGSFAVQAHFVSKITFIGTSDPAFYADVADNLIKGKGFVLDVINTYFVKFNSITHPEEYGFPGVSLILVPFILLFGKTAFAVKLPGMIAGTILLPILTYFLGKDFFNKRVGFLAAVSMLFYPAIFPIGFSGERDTLYAFFLLVGIYFFYKGIKEEKINSAISKVSTLATFLKENKYFLLMGAFLGYSYLIRQVTLAIIPVLLVIYYLLNKEFSRKFLYGIGVIVLLIFPWLIRNYLTFGDPFFTVNKYIGLLNGYIAYDQEGIFKIYWNLPKPSFSYLSQHFGAEFPRIFASKFFTNLSKQLTSLIFVNLLAFVGAVFASRNNFSKRFVIWMAFLAVFSVFTLFYTEFINSTLIYGVLRSLPFIGIFGTLLFFFRQGHDENKIFIIYWGACALFFSVIWVFDIRYWLMVIPFLLVYSWFAIEEIAERVIKSPMNVAKFLLFVLAFFVIFTLPQTYGKFLDKNAEFPFKDDTKAQEKLYLAEKINVLTDKDATIMGCDIGVFHFYTGRKYVTFPSESRGKISEIMKLYNVSYFTLLGCERRGIDVKFYSDLFNGITLSAEDYKKGYDEVVVTKYGEGVIVYKIKVPSLFLKEWLYKTSLASEAEGQKNSTVVNVTPL